MSTELTQTDRLISVLNIIRKYRHNIYGTEGNIEIRPSNWKKVTKEDKVKLKELGFRWYADSKFGDFDTSHWELCTPDGPIFS